MPKNKLRLLPYQRPRLSDRVAIINYEYTRQLVSYFGERGFSITMGNPLYTLWKFIYKEVEYALISSAAAASLNFVPSINSPAVISNGKVENVILIIKRKKRRVKLWKVPESHTGASLALWYLTSNGYEVTIVGNESIADVALYIGDRARRLAKETKFDVIDLGEAWHEVNGIPFVYAITSAWRSEPLSSPSYTWRHIRVTPLSSDLLEVLLIQNKILRPYWVRALLPPRGLLGMLLRSA